MILAQSTDAGSANFDGHRDRAMWEIIHVAIRTELSASRISLNVRAVPEDVPGHNVKVSIFPGALQTNGPRSNSSNTPDWQAVTAYDPVEHHYSRACAGCSADREEAEGNATAIASGETTGTLAVQQSIADHLLTGYWNTGYGDGTRSHNVTANGVDANNRALDNNPSGYSADADGVAAERAILIGEAFKFFEAILGIRFVETISTIPAFMKFFLRD